MSPKTHHPTREGHRRGPLLNSSVATHHHESRRFPLEGDNNKPLNPGFDAPIRLNSRISDNNTSKHLQVCNHSRPQTRRLAREIRQDEDENEHVGLESNIKLAKIMWPARTSFEKPEAVGRLRFSGLLIVLVSISIAWLQASHCLNAQLVPTVQIAAPNGQVASVNQTSTKIPGGESLISISKDGHQINGTSPQLSRQEPITIASDSVSQASTIEPETKSSNRNGVISDALAPVAAATSLMQAEGSTLHSAPRDLATRESEQVAATKPVETMVMSASKKKKKMMKKKKKMEKKHKEWKKGKKHKKKKYESKKKKGGMEKKKKGKKEKKKWGMEKKGHKKKGNFKKKKWGVKKKSKKGHKKGKKGHKMLKDKGHKKKGFKKVYHKEEWGKKKKWHDIKREKKWNSKQKKWKKKWQQEKGKKYKGKHMKKYHKKNKHGKKYKKEKKSKWKKHKGEKFKKGHKKKKEEYAKKKEGGKKKKMKKMKKEMKKKKG